MSCFWDTLIKNIKREDLKKILNLNTSNPTEFAELLKKNNIKTKNVMWNDIKITDKQLEENYNHIKDYNSSSIKNGYDCSTFDPFLILISEIFNISINHNYLGNSIKYTNNHNYTINITSNKGHMW